MVIMSLQAAALHHLLSEYEGRIKEEHSHGSNLACVHMQWCRCIADMGTMLAARSERRASEPAQSQLLCYTLARKVMRTQAKIRYNTGMHTRCMQAHTWANNE